MSGTQPDGLAAARAPPGRPGTHARRRSAATSTFSRPELAALGADALRTRVTD